MHIGVRTCNEQVVHALDIVGGEVAGGGSFQEVAELSFESQQHPLGVLAVRHDAQHQPLETI